jgi:hypothetical protein
MLQSDVLYMDDISRLADAVGNFPDGTERNAERNSFTHISAVRGTHFNADANRHIESV